MGDRGQVKIIGTNGSTTTELYFYTHWCATSLENFVSYEDFVFKYSGVVI